MSAWVMAAIVAALILAIGGYMINRRHLALARVTAGGALYSDRLLVWLDPSDSSTVALSGSTITSITDKTSNAYSFAGLSGKEPTKTADHFAAGKPAMTFDGTQQLKADVTLPTYLTVVMVVDISSWGYVLNHNNDANYIDGTRPGVQLHGGPAKWGVSRVGAWHYDNSAFSPAGPLVLTFIYGATQQALYVNNTEQGETLGGSAPSNSELLADLTLMSSSFETGYSTGKLGEVRIYSGELTADEHQAVRSQLYSKWGITP